MKLAPFMSHRAVRWLFNAMWGLTLIVLISCVAQENKPFTSISETRIPWATSTVCQDNCQDLPGSQYSSEFRHGDAAPDCSSGTYLIPTSTISNALRAEADWQGPDNRFDEQGGWLSVHLDLLQDAVPFGKPIPLLLTFTDTEDTPVIFARPQYIIFQNEHREINQTSRLVVDVKSLSGNKLPLDLVVAEVLGYIPPPTQEFSQLAPGQSCSMKLSLDWNATVLTEPLPPGGYTLQVHSEHFDPGPRVSDGSSEIWNVNAWVGYTEPSNVVTFTVLPER